MRFGKHKGCDFFFGDCHPDDVRNDIIFSNAHWLTMEQDKKPIMVQNIILIIEMNFMFMNYYGMKKI